MNGDNSKEIYRFRGIDKILGEYSELERQTIFFAHPESLNDPMEGFRDIFWQGDFIVWRNLFNHYLLCLERLCSLWIIGGEEYPISDDMMPIFHSENDFPTPQYKELFSTISRNFFAKQGVTECVKAISQRATPVRRDELLFYITLFHSTALKSIFDEYANNGFCNNINIEQQNSRFENLLHIIKLSETKLQNDNSKKQPIDILCEERTKTHYQQQLILHYNSSFIHKNKSFIIFDFPEKYLSQIEKLIFPDWYTAAFSSGYDNSSSWGHYASEHKGICLIFKQAAFGGKHYLPLKAKNGTNSKGKPSYGVRNFQFHPIDYKDASASIDFFRMLGSLPAPALDTTWYSLDGETSICADEMRNSIDEWRRSYWDKFYRDIVIKSNDWKHENEQRLILSGLIDYHNDKDRALTYDFESLNGIIFGIKTSIEDKLKIIRIIEDKCKKENRLEFKFYQAHYSHDTGRITRSEMGLLQFSTQKHGFKKQPNTPP